MFPILLVDPPILDPAEIVQLPWNTSMNDGHKMCMFAILASGARGVGNIEYATELQNRARALLGDNFDQQTPYDGLLPLSCFPAPLTPIFTC
jgi:hypothetical protein